MPTLLWRQVTLSIISPTDFLWRRWTFLLHKSLAFLISPIPDMWKQRNRCLYPPHLIWGRLMRSLHQGMLSVFVHWNFNVSHRQQMQILLWFGNFSVSSETRVSVPVCAGLCLCRSLSSYHSWWFSPPKRSVMSRCNIEQPPHGTSLTFSNRMGEFNVQIGNNRYWLVTSDGMGKAVPPIRPRFMIIFSVSW